MTSGVSIRVSGGLGNQMFQYAAARTLAMRLHVPLTLDLGFYDRGRHRGYGLDAFALAPHGQMGFSAGGRLSRMGRQLGAAARRLLGQATPEYKEPHFHHDPAFEQLRAPVHLVGHFQSPRYFLAEAATMRLELAPPPADDPLSRNIAEAMTQGDSCALHVRRGDYVSNAKNQALFAACEPAYYAAAMARLPDSCTVYVFSDDMRWAREHLPQDRELVFVDDGQHRSGLADLWLMTQAQHHVIANSSLSWWGAWLANRAPGHTTAPARWFINPVMDDRDLLPEGWTRL